MSNELKGILILNNSGKRYRLAFYLPGGRSIEMKPVGEISAEEAKTVCEEIAKAITSWNTRADTARLSELEAEVARLRSALQFYANEANWIDTPSWDGDPECITPKAIPVNRSDDGGSPCDCGDRARAALEAQP